MTPGPPRRVPRVVAAALGAWAGVTAWVSLGVVAVVDGERLTRVVALPPIVLLAGCVLAGIAAGSAVSWPRPVLRPLSLLVLPWLPWLPVRVPEAFLLWEGPLEGAIWGITIGGLSVQAWRHRAAANSPAPADPAHRSARQPWIAATLMCLVALTGWAVARPRVPGGDEPHYLVITQSLLRDGDLAIEDNHRDRQYLAYFDGGLKPDFMRRGRDRQIYSIHAPGTSAVVLPAFALAGYAGAVLSVAIIVAAGLAALWLAAYRLTGGTAGAWVSAGALMVAAPFVLMSFTIYPDPIGSAVVALALLALVTVDAGLAWSGRAWVAVGAALALLPWLHTRFAVIAAALGAVLALRAWHTGRLAAVGRLLAVPVMSAAGWFGYFWIIYGTPDPGAPYGAGSGAALSFVPQGLAGLLFDQQFGLVATAPVLVAGLAGLAALARARPRLALELVVVLVPYLMVAAAYPMWWGGFSSPARFAVVVAPVVALPAGWWWTRGGTSARAAIVAAMVVSAGLTLAVLGVDRGALIYNGRDGHALVLDWLSPLVDLTLSAPSVHRAGMTGALAATGVWAAAALVALLLAARLPRVGTALGWLATPLVVMAAVSVVGAREPRPLVTPPTSIVRMLGVWRGGGVPVAAQIVPARWLAPDEVPGRLVIASSTRGEPAGGASPLLQVAGVPAGTYDVFLDASAEPAGTVTVRLGRQGREGFPLETWRLEGMRRGFSGLTLQLPVDARSIVVTGDESARHAVRAITLRPRALAAGPRPEALRAARFGRVVVYALDDDAYLEPGAFWTRAERTARVVVLADAGKAAVMRLKAGPVANEVRLRAGAWTTTVPLAADATVDVPLPPEAMAPAVLEIESPRGFRPADTGGDDVRWLGVYVTWPDAPATP